MVQRSHFHGRMRAIRGEQKLTKAPKPEDQPILHCPACGRATVKRNRLFLGKEYVRTAPKPEGTVYAVRDDGTCDKCWRVERAKSGKPTAVRNRALDKYHHEMTDEEIERAADGLRDYWIQRRLRGVPPEGIYFDGDPL
jgi:hypothetical protein